MNTLTNKRSWQNIYDNTIYLQSNEEKNNRLKYIISMNEYNQNIFRNKMCKYNYSNTSCSRYNCNFRHLYDPCDKEIYDAYYLLNKSYDDNLDEFKKSLNKYLCGYHDCGGFHFNYIFSCRDYPFCKFILCDKS